MTTIDSPSATITTRPWRSTKWETPTTKPSTVVNRGVTQSSPPANVHNTHSASPPSAPPTSTRAAADEVERARSGGSPRTSETDAPRTYIPAWSKTTTQVAEAEDEPVAVVRVGTASAISRNPPIPPISSSRNRSRSVAIEFVSHA